MQTIQSIQRAGSWFQTADRKLTRIQCLSGNSVKMIAVLFMLFDHICKILWSWVQENCDTLIALQRITEEQFWPMDQFIRFTLYPIGSAALPLFCFLVAEGFWHTRSRKRYMGTMLLFALLTELRLISVSSTLCPFGQERFRFIGDIKMSCLPCCWGWLRCGASNGFAVLLPANAISPVRLFCRPRRLPAWRGRPTCFAPIPALTACC